MTRSGICTHKEMLSITAQVHKCQAASRKTVLCDRCIVCRTLPERGFKLKQNCCMSVLVSKQLQNSKFINFISCTACSPSMFAPSFLLLALLFSLFLVTFSRPFCHYLFLIYVCLTSYIVDISLLMYLILMFVYKVFVYFLQHILHFI